MQFLPYVLSAVLPLYLKYQLSYNEDNASLIYHAWCLLAYLSPIFGAIIADSFLGKFKLVTLCTDNKFLRYVKYNGNTIIFLIYLIIIFDYEFIYFSGLFCTYPFFTCQEVFFSHFLLLQHGSHWAALLKCRFYSKYKYFKLAHTFIYTHTAPPTQSTEIQQFVHLFPFGKRNLQSA